MFRMGKTSPGVRAAKLSEPMWTLFFELHTGPWRTSGHIKRRDTRAIEAPSRENSQKITLQYRGHPHTPRPELLRRPESSASPSRSPKCEPLTFAFSFDGHHHGAQWHHTMPSEGGIRPISSLAVDRAVEHARGIDAIMAQRSVERQGPPFAERRAGNQFTAARRPTSDRGHVGLGPGLINEDETSGIKSALIFLPLLAPTGHLRTHLFGGEQAFFEAETGRANQSPDRHRATRDASLSKFSDHLPYRHVGHGLKTLHHKCPMRLKQPLAMPAHPPRCRSPLLALALRPLHRTRNARAITAGLLPRVRSGKGAYCDIGFPITYCSI
jgi:hypothetical protein